jgi:hypothetical protein
MIPVMPLLKIQRVRLNAREEPAPCMEDLATHTFLDSSVFSHST